jgi:hypothetical protein
LSDSFLALLTILFLNDWHIAEEVISKQKVKKIISFITFALRDKDQ